MKPRASTIASGFVAGSLALALAAGCNRKVAGPSDESGVVPPPASQPSLSEREQFGSISGIVRLEGPPPALPPLEVSAVRECAAMHPDGVANESVVVAPGGSLQNVLVYLKNVRRFSIDSGPAVLDQSRCMFEPHVLAVQAGQPVRFTNSDKFSHNVDVASTENPAANWMMTGDSEHSTRFAHPEIFEVRCDVHPWMRAWVGVFENPCFCVSAASGEYKISSVPPGTYVLVARQEVFGNVEQPVTIPPRGSLKVNLTFHP